MNWDALAIVAAVAIVALGFLVAWLLTHGGKR